MNDSNLNDLLDTSNQSSTGNIKRYKKDLDLSESDALNFSGQSGRLSSSTLNFHSQSSISMKGHLNDTEVTAENLILNLQDGNDLSVLEQDFVPDKNWVRESGKITKKLERNLYETQQNNYRALDNQDIYLLSDQFIKPDHEVRAYQNEIFRNSIDKNSIFVIETDSGKLHIAMMHILHRLKMHRNKKVKKFLTTEYNKLR